MKKKAVVNLIVCNAAAGVKGSYTTNLDESFAANLHENLAKKLNRDIPVIARKSDVALMSYGYDDKAVKVTTGLVRSGKAIFDSAFTIKDPVPTGKTIK